MPSFFSEPPEILPFDFGKTVLDEGDFAHLSCIVTKGDLPINIRGDSVAKAFNVLQSWLFYYKLCQIGVACLDIKTQSATEH